MIEIVCPSCQSRYQLPDGSIGPDGRKVSCSSCSHKWRAHAEGAPAAASAPEPAAGPKSEPETVAESASMAAVAAPGNQTGAPSPPPPPASGDREDQMAAIRQMLTDLKDNADAAPEPEPEERPEPTAPTPTMRRRVEEDEDIDPLKSRIDGVDKMGRTKKGEAVTGGYSAARLRRMHEKRAKKLQRSRERRKKSGAFMTGFTLMAMVTATMVGLYVLHPQIIAASPRMEPALTEYVVTVDRYRIELNQKTSEWKEWLTERIGALGDDED